MRRQSEPHGLRARLSNPLLTLLIAAVASVGAIAQCGLMIDAALVGAASPGVPSSAAAGAGLSSDERPRVAVAPRVVPASKPSRTN